MIEGSTEVKIEDTTVQAFTTLINYIYEKPDSFSLTDIACPQNLCEILAIAERYQVTGQVHMTESALNEVKITPREHDIYCSHLKELCNVRRRFKDAVQKVSALLL